QDAVVVFDHMLATRQRIDDRIYVIVEEPLDPSRVLLGRPDEAELVEELIRNQLRGPIECALLPRDLDLAGVRPEAADVGDVQVMLRSAVKGDSTPGRKNGGVVGGVDAGHEQRGNLNVAR